ncbi:4'-phosphopantetheinyl transferase superfamily protein [Suttonella sp. R2A3]|uniref:4'-phosphopantetheinyl transferase family protein n=1 Tax=Suttonella sp. R2A3 TaxID=2908648 RepID=UPI001F2C8819|nr:4'-phosphopantetheinyl transferase superfamily protein [Suttonella sp. R2A3]UJF23677.1 4'-phosphopantetheinyl transferase superfamily protein [Suttonella sp. R2A3]
MLKQRYQNMPFSLSHKHGLCVLASATPHKPGVDLEWIKARDVRDLSAVFASDVEQQWLAQQQDDLLAFYRLWTLKEALIKAFDLDFPGGLTQVGFADIQGQRLLSPVSCAYFSAQISTHFMVSIVQPHASALSIRVIGTTHRDWRHMLSNCPYNFIHA